MGSGVPIKLFLKGRLTAALPPKTAIAGRVNAVLTRFEQSRRALGSYHFLAHGGGGAGGNGGDRVKIID